MLDETRVDAKDGVGDEGELRRVRGRCGRMRSVGAVRCWIKRDDAKDVMKSEEELRRVQGRCVDSI